MKNDPRGDLNDAAMAIGLAMLSSGAERAASLVAIKGRLYIVQALLLPPWQEVRPNPQDMWAESTACLATHDTTAGQSSETSTDTGLTDFTQRAYKDTP